MSVHRFVRCLLFALLLAGGCADSSTTFSDGRAGLDAGAGSESGIPTLDGGFSGDGGIINTGDPVVYAHSSKELYSVDPKTLAVTLVAPFGWPSLSDEMTDIAIDRDGRMIGISFDKVYAVDAKTAACTHLANLDREFNGLSFITPAVAEGKEYLMAAANDGVLYEINPTNGQARRVGAYGAGLKSSGDLVSVKGFGTVATVEKDLGKTDWLARVDPTTGQAQLIGDTGFADIWGLGYWKDKIYGFTEASEFILIDVKTGKGTLVRRYAQNWWGAGVTTVAPVIK